MTVFIKIPPHSDFTRGIFIPYSTVEEAEMQVANDLLSSDFIEGIVESPSTYDGSMQDHVGGFPRHVYEHSVVRTLSQVRKKQSKLLEKMQEDSNNAQIDMLLKLNRLREGLAEADGDFKKLHPEIKDIAKNLGMDFQAIAGRPGFAVVTGGTATAGAVALSAATAKTVIGIAAGTVGAPTLAEIAVSFDGVTASAVPVLTELVSGTNATNPPGTASTSMAAKQIRGWSTGGPSSTCAYNWTTEPTVLEVFKKRLLTPNGGLIVLQAPLDREPTGLVTAATQFKFMGLRLTAPAAVNCHADLEFDE